MLLLHRKKLGEIGENIAVNYLKKKGYRILERNYFAPLPRFGRWPGHSSGEIDIIIKKSGIIIFVEVKTISMTRQSFGDPEQKVNFLKQRKLFKTAQSWLIKKKISLNAKWQIDVIALKIDLESKKAKLRHFKNI